MTRICRRIMSPAFCFVISLSTFGYLGRAAHLAEHAAPPLTHSSMFPVARLMFFQPVRLLVSASPNQLANSVFLSQKTSTSQPKPTSAPTSEQAANLFYTRAGFEFTTDFWPLCHVFLSQWQDLVTTGGVIVTICTFGCDRWDFCHSNFFVAINLEIVAKSKCYHNQL